MKTLFFLFIGILTSIGCVDQGPYGGNSSEDQPLAIMSSEFYRGGYTYVTLENRTSEVMAVETCGGVLYHIRERLVNGAWVFLTAYQCGNNSLETTIIEPHAAMTFQIRVVKPGTYRNRIPYTLKGTYSEAVSSTFTIY